MPRDTIVQKTKKMWHTGDQRSAVWQDSELESEESSKRRERGREHSAKVLKSVGHEALDHTYETQAWSVKHDNTLRGQNALDSENASFQRPDERGTTHNQTSIGIQFAFPNILILAFPNTVVVVKAAIFPLKFLDKARIWPALRLVPLDGRVFDLVSIASQLESVCVLYLFWPSFCSGHTFRLHGLRFYVGHVIWNR